MASEYEGESDSYSADVFFAVGIVKIGLACVGVIANLIAISVLIDRSMRSSTSAILISLAVYDSVFLLASAGVVLGPSDAIWLMLTVIYPIRYIAQMGSVYSTVIVTIERFIVVAYPMKARIICTLSNSRILMVVVFIFCVGFNIPRCLLFLMIPEVNSTANASIPFDSDYMNFHNNIYERYLTTIFYFLIPYNFIVLLNIRLLMTLRKSKKRTLKLSRHHHDRRASSAINNPADKEDSLTNIVVGITGCFFVCCFIPMVYNLIVLCEPTLRNDKSTFYLLPVGDTMLCINSATDFIFYCLLGRRFRSLFRKKFCRWRHHRRDTMTSQNTGTL